MKSLSSNIICIRLANVRSRSHIHKAQGRKEKGRQVVALYGEIMNVLKLVTGCTGELCDAIGIGLVSVASMTVIFVSISQIL